MVNHPNRSKKRIPIAAAQRVAEQYGYDQVIIIARKVGPQGIGGEHVTTYGTDKANCDVAARVGNFLKHKVMGWPGAEYVVVPRKPTQAMLEAQYGTAGPPACWRAIADAAPKGRGQ